MPDAGLQRAHNGHRADAEQNAGRNKTLGKAAALGFSFRKLRLDGVTGVLNGIVDVQQLADDGSEHHAQDHAQQFLRP